MTYKDISFCLRSKERFCKEHGNAPICQNKRCFRHGTKIPSDLPKWELICWTDMSYDCKHYQKKISELSKRKEV